MFKAGSTMVDSKYQGGYLPDGPHEGVPFAVMESGVMLAVDADRFEAIHTLEEMRSELKARIEIGTRHEGTVEG